MKGKGDEVTTYITQNEHQRVTIDIADDGVRITQARMVTQGRIGAPSETVYLTKQEFAKIAKRCQLAWRKK